MSGSAPVVDPAERAVQWRPGGVRGPRVQQGQCGRRSHAAEVYKKVRAHGALYPTRAVMKGAFISCFLAGSFVLWVSCAFPLQFRS